MKSKSNSVLKSYFFLILLVCGIVLGCIVGAFWPGATALQPIGTVFVNLMLCVVVPLVFTSIASAVATMKSPARAGKIMGSSVAFFVVTGVIAATIMILICRAVPLVETAWTGLETSTETAKEVTIGSMIVNAFTVDDFSKLLSRSNLLPLIVFAILFGIGVNKVGGPDCAVAKLLIQTSEVVLQIVRMVTYLAPIAFFGLFASLMATYGPRMIGDYGRSLLVYYPTCIIYCLVMFPLWAFIGGGMPAVKIMASKVFRPVVTAMGTCSSAATIPTNLEIAAESGIPKDVAEMVIPLGATMHMDGVVLSTVVKAALLFGVFGMDFREVGIGKYALLVFIAVFAAVGSAAVPRGGLIVESLICQLFFPDRVAVAFPLILAFGQLADPGSTMVNASGDYVLCFIVSRITDGKDWLQKKLRAGKAAE